MSVLLAQYDQTSPRPSCPNRPFTYLANERTGEFWSAGCYSLSCAVCVRVLALRYAGAIGLARPDLGVLLTRAGDEWPTVRGQLNAFRRNMRRRGIWFEDVFHVEPNPRSRGTHIHMWTWGTPFDVHDATDAAARAGLGSEVMVGPRRLPDGQPISYGMKLALEPPSTAGVMAASARRFLDLNGGRLGHATRAFWRDENGERLAGVRQAMKRASQLRVVDPFVVTTIPPVLPTGAA